MSAYKITLWCDTELSEPDLGTALEQGELFELVPGTQYQIEEVHGG